MKQKTAFIASFLFICMLARLQAQDSTAAVNQTPANKEMAQQHQMNFFKINLMGLAVKNFSFQYERILSKRVSVAASYRFMPTGSLPFASSISNAIGDDDPDTKKTIENMRMGNYAITPEARIYLGKGYGKGFYIAFFYRYSSYTVENLPIDYDDTHSLNFSGKLTANTGGIMFGAQWPLGKHVCLDWWMFGPHYGSGNGNFVGLASQPLTPAQQDVLRQNLEDLEIPLTNKTYAVNANGATLKLSGPWGGIRSGLSIGIKF